MSIKDKDTMLVGIIPARGGSKGVPNKNIRALGGKPLIAHAIECGKRCPSLAHVVVSTDNAAIAEVARSYGAEVPFMRPAELAKDDTPMLPVLQHALRSCEEHYGRKVMGIVVLDPSSPLRMPKDIEDAVKSFLKDPDCDALVSGYPAHKSPYFNMVVVEDGYIRLASPCDKEIGSRQQCPVLYDLDTTVWIYSRKALTQEGRRLPKKTKLFIVPQERGFHIDSEIDFKVAEFLLAQNGGIAHV